MEVVLQAKECYEDFLRENPGHDAIVAFVTIKWKDTLDGYDTYISLDGVWHSDDIPRKTIWGNIYEEQVFFHARSIEEFYELCETDNHEEFAITDVGCFY